MSATIDKLAEAARNRGLKLVRSRVRSPGKPRFGKVGLMDGSAKALFGIDQEGPLATPDDVESYLQNLDAADWDASIDTKVSRGKRRARADVERKADVRRNSSLQAPPPKPLVRNAKFADAPELVELIAALGATIDEESVRSNLGALRKTGETPLVATLGNQIVGVCGIGCRIAIHRPAPLGRITALVVKEAARGSGIGRLLVEAAEQWMRRRGCCLVEVTSDDRRTDAHAFYRHLGYERTSIRFAKNL